MPQKKHHYVPHFYLKHFASNPRRINILNLRDFKTYPDGNLKAQCHRDHLYGLDDTLEKLLADLENAAAPAISSIIQTSKLPDHVSEQRQHVLHFLAMQMLRTPVAINKVAQVLDKTKENLRASYGGISPRLDEQLTLAPYESAKIALGHFRIIYDCFDGLNCHLLVNRTARSFVTSDNPAFKYNLFAETVRGHGMLGAAQCGFMLFTPISPRHLLMLSDKEIYKCTPIHQNVTGVDSPNDVWQLNKMQVVNADGTLLFSHWAERDDLTRLARKYAFLRKHKTAMVRELLPADGKPGNGILQTYEQAAILDLNLSFVGIRRGAKRIPHQDRLTKCRQPFDVSHLRPSPSDPGWRPYKARE
jgi:hypothetical protein